MTWNRQSVGRRCSVRPPQGVEATGPEFKENEIIRTDDPAQVTAVVHDLLRHRTTLGVIHVQLAPVRARWCVTAVYSEVELAVDVGKVPRHGGCRARINVCHTPRTDSGRVAPPEFHTVLVGGPTVSGPKVQDP